jgi:hypothetical protein
VTTKTVDEYLDSLKTPEPPSNPQVSAADASVQRANASVQAQQGIPRTTGGGAR